MACPSVTSPAPLFFSLFQRHANYADDFSRPEREVQGNHDEDFQEPADLRYPGQLESAEPSLHVDLAWMAKGYPKRK